MDPVEVFNEAVDYCNKFITAELPDLKIEIGNKEGKGYDFTLKMSENRAGDFYFNDRKVVDQDCKSITFERKFYEIDKNDKNRIAELEELKGSAGFYIWSNEDFVYCGKTGLNENKRIDSFVNGLNKGSGHSGANRLFYIFHRKKIDELKSMFNDNFIYKYKSGQEQKYNFKEKWSDIFDKTKGYETIIPTDELHLSYLPIKPIRIAAMNGNIDEKVFGRVATLLESFALLKFFTNPDRRKILNKD